MQDHPTGFALREGALLVSECLFAGAWHGAETGAVFPVLNPATRAEIATVPDCTKTDMIAAIECGEAALDGWQTQSAHERATILRNWHGLVLETQNDLASLITLESGKPFVEAQGEVSYAASFLQWFAGEAERLSGMLLAPQNPDDIWQVHAEPVGLCYAITPWNFPAAMITRKVGAALAAGCTIIVKPAPETPLTALALAKLAERAGVPAGVFSVITGDAIELTKPVMERDEVRKISFTGSSRVGKILGAQAAQTVKRVSLELGGNAPFIVFEDADIDAAIEGLMLSRFRNAGQTCVCTNRAYVQSSIYDEFVSRLEQAVQRLRLGDGFDPQTTTGPVISQSAVQSLTDMVADAAGLGARILRHPNPPPNVGSFFAPVIVADAAPEMTCVRNESFGPILPVCKFDSEEDAVRHANDTEAGLAAYIYTQDRSRIRRVTAGLDYGMIGVNRGLISDASAPFGGMKQSGIGREGSVFGIDEYIERKFVSIS